MHYNILRPNTPVREIGDDTVGALRERLAADGWALLRGFEVDMACFSTLTARVCRKITFDPARAMSEDSTQKVDAGLGPIGLHIENGNTPVCPDFVLFYSARAAFEGLQTTICDGRVLAARFDSDRHVRWSRPVTVTVRRRLPEALWKRYRYRNLTSGNSVRRQVRVHPGIPWNCNTTMERREWMDARIR